MADAQQVMTALGGILDPASGRDIVSAGLVSGLTARDGSVRFAIEVDPARGAAMEPLRRAAEVAVRALPGVVEVTAVLTAHSAQGAAPAAKTPPMRPTGPPPDLGVSARPAAPAPKPPDRKIPGIGRIIAVASGKGGVGKSTIAANLAVAMAARGMRVGLLDADVYGPSQPRMLGVSGRPSSPDGRTILPLRNHGVTLMSIGLMTAEDEAVVWRGPLLIGALQQMLTQVAWGRLDVLLVDLPPGTGDVQMTLCQSAELIGAIVVSTPQDIALIDARKAVDMFRRAGTPILGVVENMSRFVCGTCGTVHHPFGHGGAKAEADKMGVPFLGEAPLDLAIRVAGDGGAPIVAADPEGPQARAFFDILTRLEASGALSGDPAPAPGGAVG